MGSECALKTFNELDLVVAFLATVLTVRPRGGKICEVGEQSEEALPHCEEAWVFFRRHFRSLQVGVVDTDQSLNVVLDIFIAWDIAELIELVGDRRAFIVASQAGIDLQIDLIVEQESALLQGFTQRTQSFGVLSQFC